MALEGLRSTLRRLSEAVTPVPIAAFTPGDPFASSDVDAEAIRCPSCGRTIPKGSRRCEGCGQRLLLDMPVSKASLFIGAGVLAGFVVGGALVAVTQPRLGTPSTTNGSPPPSSAAGGTVPTPFVIPTTAAAALRGTTVINGRLVSEADPLARAVAAKTLPTSDVILVLRRMSVDIRAGAAMVKSLGGWPEAAAQQAALASFYDSLAAEISSGLTASVQSSASYKATAKRVITLLRQVGPLDQAARILALGTGVDLPLIVIPAAAR